MVSKAVLYLLVGVVVGNALGLSLSVAFYTPRVNSLIAELNDSASNQVKLSGDLMELSQRYTNLTSHYLNLTNQYLDLNDRYDNLTSQFDALQTNYATLLGKYQDLLDLLSLTQTNP